MLQKNTKTCGSAAVTLYISILINIEKCIYSAQNEIIAVLFPAAVHAMLNIFIISISYSGSIA